MEERLCSNGYILEDNQCVNYSKEVAKEQGLKCDKENTKLKGDYCITYEIVDAKNN